MKPIANDTFALERQIKAAELVRDQITALAGDDPEFIRDSIEGETTLFEVMGAMVAADGEDEALIDGLSSYIKKLGERKSRIEKRIEIRRALMASAMEVAELPKLETAAGTVTRKAVPPKAIITEESEIPSRFFVAQPPKLDKAALTAALKERAAAMKEPGAEAIPEIPGAMLSNGGTTIQIRK